MEGTIYHADGRVEPVLVEDSEVTLKYLQELVGGWIEIVQLGDGNVMIVDEEGKLTNKIFNKEATMIFHKATKNTDDFIVGTVLVTKSKYIK